MMQEQSPRNDPESAKCEQGDVVISNEERVASPPKMNHDDNVVFISSAASRRVTRGA